jgi:hypothetical protein
MSGAARGHGPDLDRSDAAHEREVVNGSNSNLTAADAAAADRLE